MPYSLTFIKENIKIRYIYNFFLNRIVLKNNVFKIKLIIN